VGIAVLIVEDESECLRRFVDVVLADAALALVGAVSSGQAAIAMADAPPPDAVLVDLALPDVDGIEVICHVVRHHPQAEVLRRCTANRRMTLDAVAPAGLGAAGGHRRRRHLHRGHGGRRAGAFAQLTVQPSSPRKRVKRASSSSSAAR
jgi:CheY-like chemotaxis protein